MSPGWYLPGRSSWGRSLSHESQQSLVASSPATWNEGDFGYDGVVDILDAADFLTTGLYNTGAYNPPAGAAGVVAAGPEPVGLGAIALAAVALVVHRRTRR